MAAHTAKRHTNSLLGRQALAARAHAEAAGHACRSSRAPCAPQEPRIRGGCCYSRRQLRLPAPFPAPAALLYSPHSAPRMFGLRAGNGMHGVVLPTNGCMHVGLWATGPLAARPKAPAPAKQLRRPAPKYLNLFFFLAIVAYVHRSQMRGSWATVRDKAPLPERKVISTESQTPLRYALMRKGSVRVSAWTGAWGPRWV